MQVFADSQKPFGGEGGIRTLGTPKGTTVFETAPFNHSGTSPCFSRETVSVTEKVESKGTQDTRHVPRTFSVRNEITPGIRLYEGII